MPHVIGSPCIDVMDTACVDVCPVDCIHTKQGEKQLYIDPDTCIDCGACAPACPVAAIWTIDELPAEQKKFAQINADFFKNFDLSESTVHQGKGPKEGEESKTAATSKDSDQDPTWYEVENWESKWQENQDRIADPIEVQKRYGRVRTIFESDKQFIVRFFLPEETPIHPFRFRYGLPDEMSPYAFSAETKGKTLRVQAKVKNAKIARLAGFANSFPDGFSVEIPFDVSINNVSVKVKSDHLVDLVVDKVNSDTKAA